MEMGERTPMQAAEFAAVGCRRRKLTKQCGELLSAP
jgi:hypothetical protein